MTIYEMAPYINGDKFTRETKAPERCDPIVYKRVLDFAMSNEEYSATIDNIDTWKDFNFFHPDIASLALTPLREEIFYCLKNGGYCMDVPAKCIFVFKELYKELGSVSLALKALPSNLFTLFFQNNYLNNCTMRDMFKSFIDPDYEPFTLGNLRIKHEDYDEIYLVKEDMVALLPKKISKQLADTDIPRITLTRDGLSVDGLLLRQLGGYYGATNSTYDLRTIV